MKNFYAEFTSFLQADKVENFFPKSLDINLSIKKNYFEIECEDDLENDIIDILENIGVPWQES